MSVIFVSSPYTANSYSEIEDNIKKAELVSIALIDKGWSVITPPKNTAHYEMYEPLFEDKGYEFWLEFYLEILERCDAVIMCKGWRESTGCKGEYDYAFKLGMPIYFEEEGIPDLEESCI